MEKLFSRACGRQPVSFRLTPQQIIAHARQALIGHLEGNFDQSNIALTDKQRLAIFQEQTFRGQGFSAFSPIA